MGPGWCSVQTIAIARSVGCFSASCSSQLGRKSKLCRQFLCELIYQCLSFLLEIVNSLVPVLFICFPRCLHTWIPSLIPPALSLLTLIKLQSGGLWFFCFAFWYHHNSATTSKATGDSCFLFVLFLYFSVASYKVCSKEEFFIEIKYYFSYIAT